MKPWCRFAPRLGPSVFSESGTFLFCFEELGNFRAAARCSKPLVMELFKNMANLLLSQVAIALL